MMVPEGSSAKLICKARGFPKPKITWRREDGREIIARNGPHGKTKGKQIQISQFATFDTASISILRIGNRLYEHLINEFVFEFVHYQALVVEGEMLWLTKITRSEMGIYLCIASNQVPPSVSKRMKLQIHCK